MVNYLQIYLQHSGCVANTADPDQKREQFGIGLHCLFMLLCPNVYIK